MTSAANGHMARLLLGLALAPLAVLPVFVVYALALAMSTGSSWGLFPFVLNVAASALAGAYLVSVVGGLPTLLLLQAFKCVTLRALTCGGAALGLVAGWLVASLLPFPLLVPVCAVAGGLTGWWFAHLINGHPHSTETATHAA